jgi:hypothetical protein
MAQHASTERPHIVPLQPLVHKLTLPIQRPTIDIQDQHLLAQLVLELRFAMQPVHVSVLVGKVRGVYRM